MAKGRQEKWVEAFQIDKYEVTNAQYAEFVQATGHRRPKHWSSNAPRSGISDCPVVYVSRADAEAFAKWVGCRLPTADEWEKAARGADGSIYPWGNEFSASNCNTGSSPPRGVCSILQYPTDQSPYGVQGMGGNVAEWTSSQSTDKSGYKGDVICGGSWLEAGVIVSIAAFRRVAAREDLMREDLGFRCTK